MGTSERANPGRACSGLLVGALATALLFGGAPGAGAFLSEGFTVEEEEKAGKGKKKKKKKPDLVVKSLSATISDDRPFLVRGAEPPDTIEIKDTTKNVGKGRAKDSFTDFYLGIDEIGPKALRGVGRLRKGESSTGTSVTPPYPDFPMYGPQPLRACADALDEVKESNENNNCRVLGNYKVTVVPWRFRGNVTTTFHYAPPDDGVSETAQTTGLVFETTSGQMEPYYFPVAGTLEYETSGTDSSGCTWSGKHSFPLDPIHGFLVLSLDLRTFRSDSSVLGDPAAQYTIHIACPGGGSTDVPGPLESSWFYTYGWRDTSYPAIAPFSSLSDTFTVPGGVGTTTYTWYLTAE